jgi:oligopeptide transport system substrate-binding protein
MFIKGEIDNVSLDAAGREQYGDDPRVVTVTSNYTRVIDINTGNTEKPILKNKNFRLALYYATDRATIAKLSGDTPATAYCNPLGVAYTDGTTLRQLAAKAGYEPANNGYDPVKAKEYFDKAMQEEGLTTLEISLLCSSGTSDHTFISEYVQEDWQKIFGADKFKLNIDAQPSKTRLATMKSFKDSPNAYELGISDWSTSAGKEDPMRYMQVYLSTYSSRNAPFDLYPELVEIYNAANTPENKLDEKVRAQAAMDMEKYMIENGVSIPVIYNSTYQMIADRVILAVDEYDDKIGWGWNFIDIVQ